MDSFEMSLLDGLPKGKTVNVESYRDNIFAALVPLRPQVDGRKAARYTGSARLHKARHFRTFWKQNHLRLPVHSSYSLYPAPSDFFLFGHVKHCRQGMTLPLHKEELAANCMGVAAIREKIFECVFEHWIEKRE
jgi:hypothetical protein